MRKITVYVKPGSKKGPLVEANENGELVVYVREPAAEGKANEGAIKLLADYFDVPKSKVHLATGHKSRIKHVEIKPRR